MKICKQVDLYKYNTMRLHSIADVMYFPETLEELVKLVIDLKKKEIDFYILAAGSNIIFAERIQKPIINLMSFDKSIKCLDNDIVQCGTSVRIQMLIQRLKDYSLGGIEYLYSIPCSVGGAVYMNAGRGRKFNLSISDYIQLVEYLDLGDMKIKTLSGNEAFSYRSSPFQNMDSIILNVRFRFKQQDAEETSRLIKERLLYSKKMLSADKPSCGSVFFKVNPIIIRLFKGYKCGGAIFSQKTPNWISNVNNAQAKDIETLVKKVIRVHKLFLCKYKVEVRFYK